MILNLTMHQATQDQVNAGVFNVPEDFAQRLYALLQVDELPSAQQLINRAKYLNEFVFEMAKTHDFKQVMIGGAPFLMPILGKTLKESGFEPVYAFTKREIVEEKNQEDGSVRKTSKFVHIGFVPHIG